MNVNLQKEILEEDELNELVNMIMRQTNYNNEYALEKLQKADFDYVKVIKEYLKDDTKEVKKENDKTVNEMIHGEIREFFK